MSSFLHHPAFQSLVLPALLSLLAMAALRAGPGVRWAPLGAALGLLGALAWLPGFDWPAASRAQKLPWIVLAGLALAALATARQRTRSRPGRAWAGALLGWAAASVWLTGALDNRLLTVGIVVPGAAVLALLAWGTAAAPAPTPAPASSPASSPVSSPTRGALSAGTAAALGVASLGLAALAGGGGSLLIAQLALMLGTSTAVLGLWVWLRAAADGQVTPAALMPLGLAWLALALTQALSMGPGLTLAAPSATAATAASSALGAVAPLGLLALALAVPPLLSRRPWARAHPNWVPLAALLLAALPVAAGLAWHFSAGASEPMGTPEDDPYYTPA